MFRRRRWQIYLQECSLLVQEDQSKWRQENSKFKSWVPHILGAVSRAGLKGTTKVFKHGQKSPWVPTLTGTFPNGQENAGSWLGAKNALYYCAQSANSFSWVLFVSSYTTVLSCHSCPVRSPSFPNQKQRNYQWVEKRFGCYQQEQFNLHWENSVSDGSQCIVNNRKFKMKRRRESEKAIAWQGKTTTLQVHHAFLYISLPSLHNYHVKMYNFTFCEGRKQAMTKFSFSLWTWIWLIEVQLQRSSLAFDKVSELE